MHARCGQRQADMARQQWEQGSKWWEARAAVMGAWGRIIQNSGRGTRFIRVGRSLEGHQKPLGMHCSVSPSTVLGAGLFAGC